MAKHRLPHQQTALATPQSEKYTRRIPPSSPERFINRELSWLAFNTRVLDEAKNSRHPILERLRFLSISASNLDEFYMVRVAGIRGQIRAGVTTLSQDGLTPSQQLEAIHREARVLIEQQNHVWDILKTELNRNGIHVISPDNMSSSDRLWLEEHFMGLIFPVLTPLAVDPAHPFSFIPNLSRALVLYLTRLEDQNP